MLHSISIKIFQVAIGVIALLFICVLPLHGQRKFNAWISTCSHLIGPTGDPNSLKLAVDQSRGTYSDSPAFDWDVLIDVGDWTASQDPPGDEEGIALAKCLEETLGEDRGRFFSVSGNHDGEGKDWVPGEFTRKYVNPLGDKAHARTSRFIQTQRPDEPDFRQLLDYPDTRWDRYLVRTGNVIWIMLGDRNEFDNLALARKDFSGKFQAGRGSASGMPKGGYPSGSVTLDTFNWWRRVVEDPYFSEDILITAHHHMPAFTTVSTDNGEPGNYHGKSGSLGPDGKMGGQLYWIREYDQKGNEINQYAQTRPFINYLKDNPGAIAAWVGGHTHIHNPDNSINGRGIQVRKYGVTFISVGALTDSHAGGTNQMSRLITFQENSEKALLNVYIHRSMDGRKKGWVPGSVRTFSLGKKFISPALAKNGEGPVLQSNPREVEIAPTDPVRPRYRWSLNHDQVYDFNNDNFIVGDDGSPYGIYKGQGKIRYSDDTPTGKGRSLDLEKTKGRIVFDVPYAPEMNWKSITVSIWVKMLSDAPKEILSSGTPGAPGKFKLSFGEGVFRWEVAEKKRTRQIKMKTKPSPGWHHLTAIADGEHQLIRLYLNGLLVAKKKWKAASLKNNPQYRLVLGSSTDKPTPSFEWLADEIEIHDTVELPDRTK